MTLDRTPDLEFGGPAVAPLPTPALGCPGALVLAALATPTGELWLDFKHRLGDPGDAFFAELTSALAQEAP
ncbi:MAG: hypothetical protein R3F62_15145 [Planctomycetota bacterium]